MKQRLHLAGKVLAGILCLVLALPLLSPALATETKPLTVGIFSTSDMAGRFYSRNPLDGHAEENSYLKIATAIQREREKVDSSILLDMGNALPSGFLAEHDMNAVAAAALSLRTIGYTAFVPGAAELARSASDLDALYRALTRENSGTESAVALLSPDGSAQSSRLSSYQMIEIPLGGEKVFRIGIVGQDGAQASRLSWLRTKENCNFIIVAYTGSEAQLQGFVNSSEDIDLVLGRWTDTFTIQNTQAKEVPCVGSDGTTLTKTVLTIAQDGSATVGERQRLSLSAYSDDKTLTAQTQLYSTNLSNRLGQQAGILAKPWSDPLNYAAEQGDTTDLLGRAMIWAADADIALVSPSSLGENPLPTLFRGGSGNNSASVSLLNCWALYPQKQSTLYLVELTGAQLKAWLERCAQSYQITDEKTVAGGSGADILVGASYDIYLGNPAGQRVTNLLYQGRVVEDTDVLRVALEGWHLDADESDDASGWFAATGISHSSKEVLWSAANSRTWSASSGSLAAVLAGYLRYQTNQYGYTMAERLGRWHIYPGSSTGPISRLEFVTLLYDMAGKPTPNADVAFIDVTDNNAVIWAAESGIVSGDGQGNFLPANPVTREQAAAILYNYAKTQKLTTPSGAVLSSALLDYGGISAWARPAVEFCYRTGVLPGIGVGQNLFLPKDKMTRLEAAAAVGELEAMIAAKAP